MQDNTAGTYNAAFGSNAMIRNVAGSNNTAAGANALHENLDGVHNAAFGANGLYMNTSGSNNTAAGGSSLKSNVGGARNSAFGYTALYDNVNGEQNTALGYRAGYAALGTGNVFLGANAGALETGSSRLYIANTNVATLIYGQFDTKRVAVNATDPTQTLDVNGDLRVRGLASAGVTTVAADANGVLVLATPSDARLKRDIAPLDASVDVLAALAGLHPVSYSWDTGQERVRAYGSRREIGLLAQDVERVVPEVVSVGADGFKSVDYARLTALLVAVARAQQQELEALKAEVAALRR
jgi:hypothetical protein